jgi:hypothetical protein
MMMMNSFFGWWWWWSLFLLVTNTNVVVAFTYPTNFVLACIPDISIRTTTISSFTTFLVHHDQLLRGRSRSRGLQCLVECGVTRIPWEETWIQASSSHEDWLWDYSSMSLSSWLSSLSFPLPIPPILMQTILVFITYVGLVYTYDRPRGGLSVPDSWLTVAPSQATNGGMGLFVTNTIHSSEMPIEDKKIGYLSKGTILGTYPGTILRLEQNLSKLYQYPHCEAYIWRFSDSKFIIDPTDHQGFLQDFTFGGNPSTLGGSWICRHILSWCRQSTTLCRINEPPLGFDVNVITKEDLNLRTVEFILERDVYPGEELFIDYGLSYDRSGYTKTKN